MKVHKIYIVFLIILGTIFIQIETLNAQYFGRNKVKYKDVDFKVVYTDHFTIHHYNTDTAVLNNVINMAERWYERLSKVFDHEFYARKPIILYASQPDFQSTNVIVGSIGEGTGGFTEAFRHRLVMPYSETYESFDHVLGHEMVHVFQYDIANTLDKGYRGMQNLPLWFIEGMAEYLSVGSYDPHTAMYLRDAMIRDKLPTLRDMSRKPWDYFPYRFGHAYWAYIGGYYGDQALGTLYKRALTQGFSRAMRSLLDITVKDFSNQWIQDIKTTYEPLLETKKAANTFCKTILSPGLFAGNLNIAPVLSPDGEFVIYFSEKDLFTIELYLADAKTGRNIKRLTSAMSDRHFESLRFISSGGAWSPNGDRFIFTTVDKGKTKFTIIEITSGKVAGHLYFPELDDVSNPAWSPDGELIAFTGMKNGKTDLFTVNVSNNLINRYTNDRFAVLQAVWSPDGKTIAYVSENRSNTDFNILSYGEMQICLFNIESNTVRCLEIFPDGKHINPQFSPDGSSIYFISDYDGFSDIYRYEIASRNLFRITNVPTGVSGITSLSPALSVASKEGSLIFSVFEATNYIVYRLNPDDTLITEPYERATSLLGGELPPVRKRGNQWIRDYFKDPAQGLPDSDREYTSGPYRPKLSLEFMGQTGIGMQSSQFGTFATGAITAHFSDMLGDHRMGAGILAQGTSLRDIGGHIYYQNKVKRLQWGIAAGRVPLISGQAYQGFINNVPVVIHDIQRLYLDQIFGQLVYPTSMTRRLEFNLGFTNYSFQREIIEYYRDSTIRYQLDAPEPLRLFRTSLARVGDNSFFGFTSPVKGWRYRFEVEPNFGTLTFQNLLADYRYYIFLNPVTLAGRAFYLGRYGKDRMDTRMYPLYLGQRYFGQQALVRGYGINSFDFQEECPSGQGDCAVFERLNGHHLAVVNFELRLPLFGTEDFGLINFRYLPTEIAIFFDAGTAWTIDESPVFEFTENSNERIPVFSTGISTRFNILGAIILEIYYVDPLQRPDKPSHFGFSISPGW